MAEAKALVMASGEPGCIDEQLYSAVANGDLASVTLLLQRGADPNAVTNRYGSWSFLHLAVANNRPAVIEELLNAGADMSALDRNQHTPLHTACSFGYKECIEAFVKHSDHGILTTVSPVNPLTLAVEKHNLDVVRYLVKHWKMDPEGAKDDIFKLCADNGDLEFVKFLMNDLNYKPKESRESVFGLCCDKGDIELARLLVETHASKATSDNLVSACMNGHVELTKYLLEDLKCDPNAKDMCGKAPLDCAKLCKDIIILLLKHGAVSSNAYEQHKKVMDRHFKKGPLKNPVKLFVIGFGGVGKSTLIEAMQHEKLRNAPKEVTGVSKKTAGIVPKLFSSSNYGDVQFFDFAGQEAYHGSHAAVIKSSVVSCTPVFILVVSLFKNGQETDDRDIEDSLNYWLSIVVNHCHAVEGKAPLIVVGSHVDKVSDQVAKNKEQVVRKLATDNFYQFEFKGFVPMDCRSPISTGMKTLRKVVGQACKSLQDGLEVSLNAHMFFIYLLENHLEKWFVNLEAIQNCLDDIKSGKPKLMSFIPNDTGRLVEICAQLSDKGRILFLENKSEPRRSYVIVDQEKLLAKVSGTILAPDDFKENFGLAESSGIFPKSRLHDHFPDYDITMLVGFLSQFELAIEIEDKEVLQLIEKKIKPIASKKAKSSETYLFCPALIRAEANPSVWELDVVYSHRFGWVISCIGDDKFFDIRVFQVLLLRLALSHKIPLNESNRSSNASVWKKGIRWFTIDAFVLVALSDNSKNISIQMCTDEPSHAFYSLRTDVIETIRSATKELCPTVPTYEAIILPEDTHEYPMKDFRTVDLKRLATAIVKQEVKVLAREKPVKIKDLLTNEVYLGLPKKFLHPIFNTDIESNPVYELFLHQLSNEWKKQPGLDSVICSAFSKDVTQGNPNITNILKQWMNENLGTYKKLRDVLNNISVFAGHSPLDLSGTTPEAVDPALDTTPPPAPTSLTLTSPPMASNHGDSGPVSPHLIRSPPPDYDLLTPREHFPGTSCIQAVDSSYRAQYGSTKTSAQNSMEVATTSGQHSTISSSQKERDASSVVVAYDALSQSLPADALRQRHRPSVRQASLPAMSPTSNPPIKDEVLEFIWDDVRTKWRHLGLQLGIHPGELACIAERGNNDPSWCLNTMYSKYKPKLSALVEALKTAPVDLLKLANAVEKKFKNYE